MVIGGSAKVDLPSWNPRDMEFQAVRLMARDAVLAAFHVPPSRVGLPTANYATQAQQMRTYWEALRGDAALIDEQLTCLAVRWGADDSIFHDFSAVEALQDSRDARLKRVSAWVSLGATPAAAAAYEGFDDAPVGDQEEEEPDEEVSEPERSALRAVFGTVGSLALVPQRAAWSAPLALAPVEEEARAELWRFFIEEVHAPSEREIHRAAARYLTEARGRIAARLLAESERGIRRDFADELTERILGEIEERTELDKAIRSSLRRALTRALQATVQQVGPSLSVDPSRIDAIVDAELGNQLRGLTTELMATTREAVREIVTDELAKGGTVNDMQARIQTATAFGPARALLIGRTESTRSMNAGAQQALAEAERNGVSVRKGWLSARDTHVRDAHMLLDGQVVGVAEAFVIPGGEYAGATARYPGDFSTAALVCNCRCTITPVLGKAP
jgi:hypothetical protein